MLVGIVTLKSAPWELEDNFRRLEAYVREAAGRRAQVIVAPESVLDGYVFNADPTSQVADMLEIAQTVPDGSYIQRAGALCRELGIYLIFGLLEREDQTLFNACVMLDPQGEVIAHYRKITTAGDTPSRPAVRCSRLTRPWAGWAFCCVAIAPWTIARCWGSKGHRSFSFPWTAAAGRRTPRKCAGGRGTTPAGLSLPTLGAR